MEETNLQGLTPDLRQFVEDLGLCYEEEGLPRMAGRLLGWLLVCEPAHQTAAELAEGLNASAGSISSASRILLQCGLVEKIGIPGQRSAAFRLRTGAWTDRMQAHLQKNQTLKALAERGLELMSDRTPEARQRLQELRDFEAFVVREMPALIARWEEEYGKERGS